MTTFNQYRLLASNPPAVGEEVTNGLKGAPKTMK